LKLPALKIKQNDVGTVVAPLANRLKGSNDVREIEIDR